MPNDYNEDGFDNFQLPPPIRASPSTPPAREQTPDDIIQSARENTIRSYAETVQRELSEGRPQIVLDRLFHLSTTKDARIAIEAARLYLSYTFGSPPKSALLTQSGAGSQFVNEEAVKRLRDIAAKYGAELRVVRTITQDDDNGTQTPQREQSPEGGTGTIPWSDQPPTQPADSRPDPTSDGSDTRHD